MFMKAIDVFCWGSFPLKQLRCSAIKQSNFTANHGIRKRKWLHLPNMQTGTHRRNSWSSPMGCGITGQESSDMAKSETI